MTTTTQEDTMTSSLPTTQPTSDMDWVAKLELRPTTQPMSHGLQVQATYLARASQLHLEDSPEANEALDLLASALAGMELAGLHDDTHLLNMVAHMLGWDTMPF
jgi:hypothetical protein